MLYKSYQITIREREIKMTRMICVFGFVVTALFAVTGHETMDTHAHEKDTRRQRRIHIHHVH